MKKLLCLICFFASQTALAKDLIKSDELFFKPALTIEYSAPRFSRSGVNSDFSSDGTIARQFSNFDNIALGGNFRVHKYLGFNANWYKGRMLNSELQGQPTLSDRAKYTFDQYNFSALIYIPAVENLFEAFIEGGVSDIRSRLQYGVDNVASVEKSHETVGFYGVGFQFNMTDKDLIRLSWQRYAGRIALVNTEYTTTRIGYLRTF